MATCQWDLFVKLLPNLNLGRNKEWLVKNRHMVGTLLVLKAISNFYNYDLIFEY